MDPQSSHTVRDRYLAIGAAVLTALIWSSSFVFVKMLLPEIGPFSIAGLRYFLGSLLLLPWVLPELPAMRQINKRGWIMLLMLGISSYAIGNGVFFWALEYLPATTASFMMSLKPLLVLFAGIIFLKELPNKLQIIGILISLSGSVFFFKDGLIGGQPLGLVIASVSIVGFTSFGILGRALAREQQVGTLLRTAIPLAFGGGLMLLVAFPLEGIPHLSSRGWVLVLILAVVNTTLGYLLHNYAIRILYAFEMDIFLSLAPLGTAVLAWLLLGEIMQIHQIFGMFIVIIGVGIVQAASSRRKENITGSDRIPFTVEEKTS
ncbi:MAG: EamA family transporter [Anaerolineales bacterium]|nr:EamA family transporter [Anaerolineales bacterium]